jgi:hypothetical protein
MDESLKEQNEKERKELLELLNKLLENATDER